MSESKAVIMITAIKQGGWTIYSGDTAFAYIQEKTQVNLHEWLINLGQTFTVTRSK